MFKFVVLVFAALFAVAAARPSVLASSPVVYSSHLVQPHYSVPLVKTVVSPVVHGPLVHPVATPLVHAAPLVHSSAVYSSYGAVVKSYAPGYGILKN